MTISHYRSAFATDWPEAKDHWPRRCRHRRRPRPRSRRPHRSRHVVAVTEGPPSLPGQLPEKHKRKRARTQNQETPTKGKSNLSRVMLPLTSRPSFAPAGRGAIFARNSQHLARLEQSVGSSPKNGKGIWLKLLLETNKENSPFCFVPRTRSLTEAGGGRLPPSTIFAIKKPPPPCAGNRPHRKGLENNVLSSLATDHAHAHGHQRRCEAPSFALGDGSLGSLGTLAQAGASASRGAQNSPSVCLLHR